MTIRRLFTHQAVVWRPAAVDRTALQDTVERWEPLPAPAGRNARPDLAFFGRLQDFGPGEQQATFRRWFLARDFDVRERDVIQVTAGPQAPVLLRVLGVTAATGLRAMHHWECNVDVWHGQLTPDDSAEAP